MSKIKTLKKIKLELIKDEKYQRMLKYNNSLYLLKYFSVVILFYISLMFVDSYINSIASTFFFVVYFSASILIFLLLCLLGYFENKLIYDLSLKNECLTLNDFYNLVLLKNEQKKDADYA